MQTLPSSLQSNPYAPSNAPDADALPPELDLERMGRRPPVVLVTQVLILLSLIVNIWGLGIFATSIPAYLVTQTPLMPTLISLILPVAMLIGFAFLLWGLILRRAWSRWGGAAFYAVLLVSVAYNMWEGSPAVPDPITANLPGLDLMHPYVVAARWGAHGLVLVLALAMFCHWLTSPRLRFWFALDQGLED